MRLPRPVLRTTSALILAALVVMPGLAARPEREPPAAGQSPQRRINLGVLRADGVLMPFASFDGDDWKAPWPADLTGRDLPASVASVPRDWWGGAEPESWRLLSRDGQTAQTLKASAPAMIIVGRHRRLGLRTDHTPAAVNALPFEVPFPKAGLAVAGDVEVNPILSVSRLGPAWQQLLQGVHAAMNSAEERTVSGLRANAGWKHPFDKPTRARIQPELEAWYMTPLAEPGRRVSYIEAVKKYPLQPKDQGCGLETFITGWIHHDDKQERPKAQFKATVMYCDRDKASYMLPFGQIEIRNRTHWIYQMSGQDHEWYAVAEATPTRVRVLAEYFGGGLIR